MRGKDVPSRIARSRWGEVLTPMTMADPLGNTPPPRGSTARSGPIGSTVLLPVQAAAARKLAPEVTERVRLSP
jgi:hypothetical protein